MKRRQLLLLTFLTSICFGQRFEIGAKVGIPVTEAFGTGSYGFINFGKSATSATRRYTVGPTVGIRLAHGFSATLDVLYKRLGVDETDRDFGVLIFHTRTSANSWEFPVLGRFRVLRAPVVSPYIEGGVSFRSLSGIATVREGPLFFPEPVTRTTGTSSRFLNNRSSRGVTVGLGAEIRAGFTRIAPVFRYTRWGVDQDLDSFAIPHSNQNQAEVLLGITF